MSLYDPDLFVFDSWNVWSYEGTEAWRSMTQDWFTSLGAERVAVEFTDERSSGSGALAYAAATVRYTALSAGGQSLRSLQNRITVVLELKNGTWRIVHQHTSSPIDFETKSAILDSR
jgi:ketosteroid isomerase-like protein